MNHRFGPLVLILVCAGWSLPAQGFVDVGVSAGVQVPINNFQSLGQGACFADFDGDHDLDAIIARGFDPAGQNNIFYFRNNNDGTFTDITPQTGLFNSVHARAVMAADVDNDGDLDVFIANSWWPDQLWINDGTAVFTEEGGLRGVDSTQGSFTASFGDFNRDGWIDLYVGAWQGASGNLEPNLLYENQGNGYFVDVTNAAGVGNLGLTFTGIFHDFNEDGWPDIFVGNDKGFVPGLFPNTTYENNGDGTFTDVGSNIGTLVPMGAMGSDFGDVFNDGGWDIFVSNTQAGHVFHVWDPALSTYTDQAAPLGVAAFVEGWATHIFDYDNDGYQDIYVTHDGAPPHLYKNPGSLGPAWTNMAPSLGLTFSGARKSSTLMDYDNDGRLDVFISLDSGQVGATSIFLRNTVPAGNWLRVRTVGTRSNRDGIGATLIAYVGNNVYRRQVKSGTGYLGGCDLRVHFGLGTASVVDRLQIIWPSGQVQEFWNVQANQELVAYEPMLSLNGVPLPGSTTTLEHLSGNDAGKFSVLYLSLGTSPGLPLGDGRVIPGNLDVLGTLTFLNPGNPILPAPMGFLDTSGFRGTSLLLPPLPQITGLTIHATGAALDGSIPAPWAPVRNILDPLPITIQ